MSTFLNWQVRSIAYGSSEDRRRTNKHTEICAPFCTNSYSEKKCGDQHRNSTFHGCVISNRDKDTSNTYIEQNHHTRSSAYQQIHARVNVSRPSYTSKSYRSQKISASPVHIQFLYTRASRRSKLPVIVCNFKNCNMHFSDSITVFVIIDVLS